MLRTAGLLALLCACHRGGDARRDHARVVVVAAWPGEHADAVEAQLAEPLEGALALLRGAKHITAHVADGLATLEIEPASDDAFEGLMVSVRGALGAAQKLLPSDAMPPLVTYAAAREEAMLFAAPSPWAARSARPLFERLSGVRAVDVCGDASPAIRVDADLGKLTARGLDLLSIARAIGESNRTVPGGSVQASATQVRLRVDRPVASLDELGATMIGDVRISDIATVGDDDAPDCLAGTTESSSAIVEVRGDFERAEVAKQAEALKLISLDAERVETIELALASPLVDPGVLRAIAKAAAPGAKWAVARLDSRSAPLRVRVTVGFGDESRDTRRTALLAGATAAADAVAGRGAPRPVVARVTGVGEVEAPLDATAGDAEARAAVQTLRARGVDAGCAGCDVARTTELTIDRDRAAQLGVSLRDVAQTLAFVLGPQPVGTLAADGEERPITLGLAPSPYSRDDVLSLARVPSPHGAVPLNQIVTAVEREAPRERLREDRRRVLLVWARGDGAREALAKVLPRATIRERD